MLEAATLPSLASIWLVQLFFLYHETIYDQVIKKICHFMHGDPIL